MLALHRYTRTQTSQNHFCLISPHNLGYQFLPNVRRTIVFFLVGNGSCPCTLPSIQFLSSLSLFLFYFFYCWTVNTDLKWGKWGLQFLRCCSGTFGDLLDESLMWSWRNFDRLATTQKVSSPFQVNSKPYLLFNQSEHSRHFYNKFHSYTHSVQQHQTHPEKRSQQNICHLSPL